MNAQELFLLQYRMERNLTVGESNAALFTMGLTIRPNVMDA